VRILNLNLVKNYQISKRKYS